MIEGLDQDEKVHDTVFMLNTYSMQWSTRAPLPRPGFALGVVELDGMIYVVGGGETHLYSRLKRRQKTISNQLTLEG